MIPIDAKYLTREGEIRGEDDAETVSLRKMLDDATTYLRGFGWCTAVSERYLVFGIGRVLALCLFRLAVRAAGADEWLWVVEGDLPSAYFVMDRARDPASALNVYCELMEEWADAVLANGSLDRVFPVDATPTQEHATMLKSRVDFIRRRVIPECGRSP